MILKLVILLSKNGTLLEPIFKLVKNYFPKEYRIVSVGSSQYDVRCLDVSKRLKLPSFVTPYSECNSREEFSHLLYRTVELYSPDLIIMAGFRRIVTDDFIEPFKGRILNLHPSLLPSFKGSNAINDALDYGVRVIGTTLHIVEKDVDSGTIIDQRSFYINYNISLEKLKFYIRVRLTTLEIDMLYFFLSSFIKYKDLDLYQYSKLKVT